VQIVLLDYKTIYETSGRATRVMAQGLKFRGQKRADAALASLFEAARTKLRK